MVVFEDIVRDVSGGLHTRPSVVRRAVICLIAGAIEATAAACLVYLVAITYHFAVLQVGMGGFDHLAYLLFATLAGLLYGTFSAIACERMLSGENRLEWALSTSFYSWTAAVGITLLSAFLAGNVGDLSRVTLTTAFVLGSLVLREAFGLREILGMTVILAAVALVQLRQKPPSREALPEL